MPRYARTLFGLKNVEAVDIDDPVSFGMRERTRSRRRNEKDGLRNGCSVECRKHRTQCAAEKRARLGSPVTATPLENDFRGFRWIDDKPNEYQSLNISGKGVIARCPDVHRSDIRFPDDRLVLPEIAVVKPCLVTTGQAGPNSKRQRPGRRRKRKDSFELFQEEGDCGFLKQSWDERERVKKDRKEFGYLEQRSWDGREKIQKHDEDCGFLDMKRLEDRAKDYKDPRKKIFINVILPKITS